MSKPTADNYIEHLLTNTAALEKRSNSESYLARSMCEHAAAFFESPSAVHFAAFFQNLADLSQRFRSSWTDYESYFPGLYKENHIECLKRFSMIGEAMIDEADAIFDVYKK